MMHSNTTNNRSGDIFREWQQEIDKNEDLVKTKRLKVGCNVKTEHGTGKMVGRDHPYRVVVEITNPINQFKKMVSRFKQSRLCYFPKEIEVTD